MLVSAYDSQSSRQLAGSISVRAAGRPAAGDRLDGTRVVDIGGGWHTGTWRVELRQLADRARVTALALRTEPDERQLSDHDWSEIVRGMADRLGLTDRPWVAVRTNPTTLTLLTDAANGPLHTDAARAYARTAAITDRLAPSRAGSRPVESGTVAPAGDTAQTDTTTAPARGIAQLNFAAPPAVVSVPTAAAPAPPSATAVHQSAVRPRIR